MKPSEQRHQWTLSILTLSSFLLALYYGLWPEESLQKLNHRLELSYVKDAITTRYLKSDQTSHQLSKRAGIHFNYQLRILPVGDSITEGWLSGDGNGYRLRLRDVLVADGNSVDFIGALSQGNNNPDNQHEGYGGKRIDEIEAHVKSDRVLFQNPNIILLHAGTNDMNQDPPQEDVASAPQRLAALIDLFLCQNPDAVLFVAAILQIPGQEARVDTFNKAIPGIIDERFKKGYKIRMVNFYDIMTPSDLRDGVHPSDPGYQKMGDVWYSAINNIPKSWITLPRDPETGGPGGSREECKAEGLRWFKANGGNPVALGAHVSGDTGIGKDAEPIWIPYWPKKETKAALGVKHNGSEIVYADIDGDGFADYVWVVPTNGALVVWINKGGTGYYTPLNNEGQIADGTGTAQGVYLVDLNGDKRADYVVVRDDGTFQTFINGGPYGNTYYWPELQKNISPGGTNMHNVIWGDLNGDGRKDLLIIRENGKIDGYIQQGNLLDDSFHWQVCEGIVYNSDPHLLMADLDGDGFDDFLSVDDNGGLTGYLNVPGGGPCGISWVPLGNRNDVAVGAGPRGQVRLADFNGDGKDDYLVVAVEDGSVDAYLNLGWRTNVSQMVGVGAGVRLADLNGDGLDDYIAVGPDTSAIGFYNGGTNENGDFVWPAINNWKPIALGAQGAVPGAKRHQIHFADMNGDGLADYLVVDDETGAVTGYYNNGRLDGTWIEKGKIAEGVPHRGGTPGVGVRFGDLDGDGRWDYLWLDEKGAMLGFLNKEGGSNGNPLWIPLNSFNPIALGVGAKRQDIQLVDINGDGKVDYLWVHPEQGAVDIWWNGGTVGDNGDWLWIPGGTVALGIGYPGNQVKFGRIGTSGRYDYLGINALSGAMVLYLNGCAAGDVLKTTTGGGDANNPKCLDPPLPPTSKSDDNAPFLLIPPPIGGEPIPPPEGGNPTEPPDEPTTTPTTTRTSTTTTTTSTTSSGTPSPTSDSPCFIDTTIGLCPNGNYPVYDDVKRTIDCSGTLTIGECQQDIDNDAEDTRDFIENEKDCCPNLAKRDLSFGVIPFLRRGLTSAGLLKRANPAAGYCPIRGQDPHSPPPNQCYATWTCDDRRWPNVCGNAKSAIEIRRSTDILTYAKGRKKHDTSHMYDGRYLGTNEVNGIVQGGWNVKGCQAEEYPFGAFDPNPAKNPKLAVLRMIPGGRKGAENQKHGGHMPHFAKGVEDKWADAVAAQQNGVRPPTNNGNGIIFCVKFRDSFTQFLPEQQIQQNECARLYGVEWGLVNGDPENGVRTWDPWFNIKNADPQPRKRPYLDHYKRKLADGTTINIYDSRTPFQNGDVPVIRYVPPTYCQNPSPGNRHWVSGRNGPFVIDDDTIDLTRDDTFYNDRKCSDPPAGLTNQNGKRDETGLEFNITRAHARDLVKRQSTKGFLDPKVYTYMGCGGDPDLDVNDLDPCPEDPSSCPLADGSLDSPDQAPGDGEDLPPADPSDTVNESPTSDHPTDTSGPFPTIFPEFDNIPSKRSCFANPIATFDPDSVAPTAQLVCGSQLTIPASTNEVFNKAANGVGVTYGWAPDQSGCNPKKDFTLTASVCTQLIENLADFCQFNDPDKKARGGGSVIVFDQGCVLLVVRSSDS